MRTIRAPAADEAPGRPVVQARPGAHRTPDGTRPGVVMAPYGTRHDAGRSASPSPAVTARRTSVPSARIT